MPIWRSRFSARILIHWMGCFTKLTVLVLHILMRFNIDFCHARSYIYFSYFSDRFWSNSNSEWAAADVSRRICRKKLLHPNCKTRRNRFPKASRFLSWRFEQAAIFCNQSCFMHRHQNYFWWKHRLLRKNYRLPIKDKIKKLFWNPTLEVKRDTDIFSVNYLLKLSQFSWTFWGLPQK